jgi:hypothetical protein
MKRQLLISEVAIFLVATAANTSAQVTLFEETFEAGNLSQWTGKAGFEPQGQIVTDPLNPLNRVLTFTGVNAAGDIFSASPVEVTGSGNGYVLSFDFLALPIGGVAPSEYGGFAGITTDPNGLLPHFWLGGTYPGAINVPAPVATVLVGDGAWHHYEIDFTDVIKAGGITSFQVMLEDWYDRGSIPGDVYFDNVSVVTGPSLIEQLIALVEGSNISARGKRALLATLAAASDSLERGQNDTAVNQLRAFQHKVRAQVNAVVAEALVDAAQGLIDSLILPP